MRERDARALYLARPRLAAELVHELDDLTESRRAEWFALRQQATARVHRQLAAERGRARGQERGLVARRAEVELLVGEQLTSRVGVLALDHVDVTRTDAGLLVRVARGQG